MSVFLIGLLFSALLAMLYAGGELVVGRRDEKTWILFGVFFALGCMLLHAYGLLSGFLVRWPHFLGWHLPFFLALGPLLDRFIQVRLAGRSAQAGWRLWLPFVPAATTLVGLLFYLSESPEAKREVIENFRLTGARRGLSLFFLLSNLHFSAYLLLGTWRVGTSLRWVLLRTEPTVRILFYILFSSLLISGLVFFGFATGHALWIAASLALMSLVLPSLYLIRQRYPSFFRDLALVMENEKYRTSRLRGADLDEIARSLDRLMRTEHLYRDEELSLAGLAERVELTPHQLSEYFNNHLKQNFARYINHHRIQEARDLLTGQPEQTVLAVAYQVGFNSKSSFNAAFARETGLSPRRYRARFSSQREAR